jgi:uncharacterized protein involved in outer membrane biogenesis
MSSFRWLLIIGGVAIVLALLALGPGTMWLNSFIRSDAFRHQVESGASQTLGGPVQIKQIDFSVWSGVKLTGLAAKLNSPQGTLVTQVEGVNCSYSWLALLGRKFQIDGVTMVKPQIVLTQEPPSAVPTPAPPSVPTKQTSAEEAQSGKTSPFEVVLDSAKIDDGSLSIRDATGQTKAALEGLQVHADTAGYYTGKEVSGKLKIANISLPQNLNLTSFSTPFTYQAGTVTASPFEATAYAGKLTGDYKLDPSGPSLLEINISGLDVSQIGRSANPGSASKLSGSLALQSKWNGVETGKLTGEGDVQITNGRLSGVGILHDLAFALRVRNLSDPELKSVTTHFQVANGETHFTDLKIDSDVFDMTGSGVISPNGQLDANMVLSLHGDAMGGVSGVAASLFSRLPGGGGSIPFHISGTVAHPQTNLSPSFFLQSPMGVEKSVSKGISHLLFH